MPTSCLPTPLACDVKIYKRLYLKKGVKISTYMISIPSVYWLLLQKTKPAISRIILSDLRITTSVLYSTLPYKILYVEPKRK